MTQIPDHTCYRSVPATTEYSMRTDRAAADPATEVQCPACAALNYEAQIRALERKIAAWYARRERKALKAQLQAAQERIAALEGILVDLVDASTCSLDHHGYCQEHCWLQEGPCPHGRGQELISKEAFLHQISRHQAPKSRLWGQVTQIRRSSQR